jgi:hypothetical protein
VNWLPRHDSSAKMCTSSMATKVAGADVARKLLDTPRPSPKFARPFQLHDYREAA